MNDDTYFELGLIPSEFTSGLKEIIARGDPNHFPAKFRASLQRLPAECHTTNPVFATDGPNGYIGISHPRCRTAYTIIYHQAFYRAIMNPDVVDDSEYDLYETMICRDVTQGLVRLQVRPTDDAALLHDIVEAAMHDYAVAQVRVQEQNNKSYIIPYLFEVDADGTIFGFGNDILQWANEGNLPKLNPPLYQAPPASSDGIMPLELFITIPPQTGTRGQA